MESSPRVKAYKVLKKLVQGSKNLRLVRLAATVRTATQGHFDDVIASIDTMLQTLKDEEADDIAQLEAKIEKAELKKKKLEQHKEQTEDAKEQLLDDMAQALADRQAENQNFHNAKDDDVK